MKTSLNRAVARKMTGKFFYLVMAAIAIMSFDSCKKDDDVSKNSGFNSAEEFIENPSIKQATGKSGTEINKGNNPPALAGNYLSDGWVINASHELSSLVGIPINSQITLYNQTASGKINFKETVQGITAMGNGGYITGENGKFTIYIESVQSGSEAGLPNDMTITVALVMSGTKLANGNLKAEGLSVITDIQADKNKYPNRDAVKGSWWKWKADMELTGAASAKKIETSATANLQNIISECLTNKILK